MLTGEYPESADHLVAPAVAGLLQALAAIEHDVDWPHTVVSDDGHYDTTYCEGCGEIWPCWPSTVYAAAESLANVILGYPT